MKKKIVIYLGCLGWFFSNLPLLAQTNSSTKPMIRLNEMRRIGAMCEDGTRSKATGRGACAGHGGVSYWFYTEATVYQSYQQNLPAIPNNQIIRLSPEEVKDLLKLAPVLDPVIEPEAPRHRRSAGDEEREVLDSIQDKPSATQKPEKIIIIRESTWSVSDFLIPFVLVLALVLLFVLIYWVVRRVL